MRRAYQLLSLVLASLLFISCSGKKEVGAKKEEGGSDKVLVSVGSQKITEKTIDELAAINPSIKRQIASPFGKKKLLSDLVEQELMYQAASKAGAANSEMVAKQLEFFKRYVIVPQVYLSEKLESEAKKYYNEHQDEFTKLRLSHIFISFGSNNPSSKPDKGKKGKEAILKKGKGKEEVKAEEQTPRSKEEAIALAASIKSRLEKGEDFAQLAETYSDDKLTSKSGGDLGLASKNEPRLMRRGFGPLLEKAFTLKEGEVFGPIELEKGVSIIKVTEAPRLQPFEDVEEQIKFNIREKVRGDLLSELKKEIQVSYYTEEENKPQGGQGNPESKTAPAQKGDEGNKVTPPAEAYTTPTQTHPAEGKGEGGTGTAVPPKN